MAEEYEILPHKLLSDLKDDVEALKKKLTEPDQKANELILEIESLKDSIHELNTIFHKALDEAKNDPSNMLKQIAEQNETIAQGMVAISDKLEAFMHTSSQSRVMQTEPKAQAPAAPPLHELRAPAQTSMRAAQPPRMAPMPSQGMPAPPAGFPPPPPSPAKKKRSLFR